MTRTAFTAFPMIAPRKQAPKVPLADVQRTVAAYYRISLREMTSARRDRYVARPRQIAMYLAKLTTPRSLPDIGRRFGGRDHTTVMHAIKRISELIESDPEIAADVQALREVLAG